MDTTMFQLRTFVHQRLYSAAEEILGEVEKTITLALYEAEVSRSKEEVESLRQQLDILRKKPAEQLSLTSSTVKHEDECDVPLHENPKPSTPEESNFCLSTEVPEPSHTSSDMDNNNWNYCLVHVGEVCHPESFSNRNPTPVLQQPIESNKASANDVPFSLSLQIPLSTNPPQFASLKMPRRMKRKRTAGLNPQENSLDPLEQTASPSISNQQQLSPNISTNSQCSLPRPTFPSASQFSSYNTRSSKTFHQSVTSFPSTSNTRTTFAQIHPLPLTTTNLTASAITIATINNTGTTSPSHTAVLTHSAPSSHHTPAAPPAPYTPKIFKEICSILPLSSGGKKKRCKITVEELARRVGPPEYMSFSSLAAYLRTDNNARRELQAQLEDAGIKPTEVTTEMSLFSRLCEEEVEALCKSLAGLVRDHLPFQGLYVIPEAEDEVVTLERLSEFRSHLRRAIAAIKERVEAVDLASHGFMSRMLDIILSIFENCLENQMNSIY
ncbi:uncharacterized protein [Chaetodon trifascialis]|uniref:uncharacterized protein n=1 Tax=Chaetodon trifascialis TaxID=109706 RepID=UPI003994BF04